MDVNDEHKILQSGSFHAILALQRFTKPDPDQITVSINVQQKLLQNEHHYVGLSRKYLTPFDNKFSQEINLNPADSMQNFVQNLSLNANNIYSMNQLRSAFEAKELLKTPELTHLQAKERGKHYIVERITEFANWMASVLKVAYNPSRNPE
jgi:hypothetical protein